MNGEKINKKAVLVTGGAGFIGSHTVVQLLEEDRVIVVIDNLSNAAYSEKALPPSLERVKEIVTEEQGRNLHFRKASYGDKAVLNEIFSKFNIEAVIHFGGFKAVGQSKKFPLMYYKNNISETLSLIEAMNEQKMKRMLFSSSATVYTELPPDKLPLIEDGPLGNCTCPYANTKFFLENIFRDVVAADPEWQVMALRYFNPVGAHKSGKLGEDPKGVPHNLMPYIAQVAVGRRTHLNVYGSDFETPDGTGVRDYVHVMDVARGHAAALQALPEVSGFRPYNLGSGRATSVLEMVKAFEEVSGRKIPYELKDRRPGDTAIFYCNSQRAWDELGWKTEKSIKEMCEDLWRFQTLNPNGYIEPNKV